VFKRALLCALLLAGSPLYAVAETAASRPNIILITLDTVRADRMGFLGSKLGLTPNLDSLSQQSVVFERAYSQVPFTYPSHATILTGTYPQFHHVNDFGVPLAKNLPDLPDILKAHGYKTAAVVGSVVLDPAGGWVPGIGRGFDTYDADFGVAPDEARSRNLERPADEVVAHALTWLERQRGRPFFLWVHLYDPHAPYDPPEPFKARFAATPYDGEIAYVDSALGKFFASLRARRLYDNSVIAVMSDHGEAFGEHGEHYHGIFLYDETIRVPLVFRYPGQHFAGTRVNSRAELTDVLPTLLETAHIPVPKAVQGVSLLPAIKAAQRGEIVNDRAAYAETDYPHVNFGWSSLRSLRTDKYLFIEAPRKELYDQSLDASATRNLASSSAAVTQTLTDRLESFRKKTASAARVETANPDPRRAQQLAALGYVSGNQTLRNPGDELTGADPKDKVDIAALLDEALLLQGEGRMQDSIQRIEAALAKDPNLAATNRTLGAAWLQLGDYKKAVAPLRKTVELGHESANDHYQLGRALFHTEDVEGAKAEVKTAIARASSTNPKYLAVLHNFLAAIYLEAGTPAYAERELETAVQLDAEGYEPNLTLGRLMLERNDASRSLTYLKKAAQLRPDSPDPHAFLAQAYAQLGRETEATVERLEVERLQQRPH
jgi:choline-sulfatase